MSTPFSSIPDVVVDYVRTVFGAANDRVSKVVASQPSMYEESLDHVLIMELTAAPPAFFAKEKMAVSIESHWLGSRHMFGRWEIADIAFFILLRGHGRLLSRKVALLQTKRLYSREIAVREYDESDYLIGIGRLADMTDPVVPLSSQRAFTFDLNCVYGATSNGHGQVERIDSYMKDRDIPVHYGFYNPPVLPFKTLYPFLDGILPHSENAIGCRVAPAEMVHTALLSLPEGRSPSVSDLLSSSPLDPGDENSIHGWRLERFIADEVLRCRQGRLFDDLQDPTLRGLLYGRSAPIAAAVAITIDMAADGPARG